MHIRKITIIFIIAFTTTSITSNAQSNRWKRMRYEVFGGIGASNFLGELGGSDKVGSNFVSDLELSLTRPALMVGGRYWLDKNLILQTAITWGYLRGDDSKTEEKFRQERDLHFKTTILEWQFRLEYTLIASKRGHRYNLRKVRGRPGNKITLDAYLGICAFYFNPKMKSSIDGEWYALQPMGTEGQNYIDTRDPYSRIQIGIPLGLHLKYILNRKWSIGLDMGPRYTFTDYIDDVSTSYADMNSIIEHNKNDKASDDVVREATAPILVDDDVTNDSHAAVFQQRGNAFNNDIYMFMFVSVNYKLRTGRNGLPKLR